MYGAEVLPLISAQLWFSIRSTNTVLMAWPLVGGLVGTVVGVLVGALVGTVVGVLAGALVGVLAGVLVGVGATAPPGANVSTSCGGRVPSRDENTTPSVLSAASTKL